MGLDVDAHIMVGFTTDDIKIERMPYYSDFKEESRDMYSWFSWLDYVQHVVDDDSFADLEVESVYVDGPEPDQICVGFKLAETPAWEIKKIDMVDLINNLSAYGTKFIDIFGFKASVYLLPRMW